MPLVAHRANTGQEIEAFSFEPSDWDAMRKEPQGSYVMESTGIEYSYYGNRPYAHESNHKVIA